MMGRQYGRREGSETLSKTARRSQPILAFAAEVDGCSAVQGTRGEGGIKNTK
jgi:hypothetical protein